MKMIKLTTMLLVRQLRDSAYSIWLIVLPQILYAGIRLFFSGTAREGGLLSALALFLALTAGLLNQPLLYAQMREDGLIKRFTVTPLPAVGVPLAALGSTLLLSLAGLGLLTVISLVFGDIRWEQLGLFLLTAALVLAASLLAGLPLPFYLTDFLTLKNAANIIVLVLFAFAGIFFTLPGAGFWIHFLDPAFMFYKGLRLGTMGLLPAWPFFLTLMLTAAAGIGLTALKVRNPV